MAIRWRLTAGRAIRRRRRRLWRRRRTRLQPEARQRVVNKIMEVLKKHLPIYVPEGLNELQKIAIRFEEKIFTAAVSQFDYLRKIYVKMLSMELKTQQNAPINPSMSNGSISNQTAADTDIDRDASMSTTANSMTNFNVLCESISHAIQDVATSLQNISNYFNSIATVNEYQHKVYQGLLAIEDLGLTESHMIDVGEIIISSPSTLCYFFSLPAGVKKTFVWKKLGLI